MREGNEAADTLRILGADDMLASVHGQGTWELERGDRDEAVRALRRGFDLGLTHVDTAEMYGSGEAELVVGTALSGRRNEVFLTSKVLPHNASRAGTIAACEASLTRLGVECLDLYLLHWPGSHPLEETFGAFEELKQRGLIRAFGLSNFDAAQLRRAAALAGADRIACNQVLYHLEERAVEHRVLPACHELGIALVAYSPFGSGDFPAPGSAGGLELSRVAQLHGATPRQVALAFIARHAGSFTIPKAARVEHVEDNAGALGLQLTADDVRALDAAFPLGKEPRSLPVI